MKSLIIVGRNKKGLYTTHLPDTAWGTALKTISYRLCRSLFQPSAFKLRLQTLTINSDLPDQK